jgi:hypothetical protein
VYLDTDQHLVRSIPKSWTNKLGWQDDKHVKINGAIMLFEKGNPFLLAAIRLAIPLVLDAYRPKNWGIVGPTLLTNLYKGRTDLQHHVEIMEWHVFYPFHWKKVHLCFNATSTANPVTEQTVSVHLNTKVTSKFNSRKTVSGSVCNDVFHKYCIFCDEV